VVDAFTELSQVIKLMLRRIAGQNLYRIRLKTFQPTRNMTQQESSSRLKIYTKTGDKGSTSLFTGERKPKDAEVFEALGTVDELTSMIGLAREYAIDRHPLTNEIEHASISEQLERIQSCLQDVNSNLATPRTSASEFKVKRTEFDVDGSHTKSLESWIDQMDASLPPLKNFILPVFISYLFFFKPQISFQRSSACPVISC
jgi:ATP:cob(I)alamin adenosyltransferase